MKSRIQELRGKKKLTQCMLAEKLGVSQQDISKIETGRCMPSYKIAFSISKLLGCTIDELYADAPEKEVS